MDYFASTVESLAKQASQITMYDVKSAVNKAKGMVLNLSEIEIKVREATNDDAWGASSTLMQEIAQASFNFQLFNEIMPTIYGRFTEKEARQWRQIYKSLVLLEYLIKNGSERVIDDARSHLGLIKTLRNFHYIDDAGKDQGINVRNRSKELGELLSDLDRVRQERRKAKANRNKYTGVGNDGFSGGGPSFQSASGSRYGGFGSDSFYEGSSGGGGGGGGHSSGYNDSSSRADDFEEYDAGDDDAGPTRRRAPAASSSRASQPSRTASKPTPPPPVAKQPEVNLFDFDDDEPQPVPPPKPASFAPQAVAAAPADDFDDFDDFQSATPSAPAPAPVQQQAQPARAAPNVFDLLNKPQATPSYQQPPVAQPSYQQPALSSFAPMQAAARPQPSATSSFASASSVQAQQAQPAKPKPADDFSDLFALAAPSGGAGSKAGQQGPKLSMQQLASKQREESLFKPAQAQGGAGGGSGWDSLL